MSDVDFKEEFAVEYSSIFEKHLRKLLNDGPILKQACKDRFGKLLEPDEEKEPEYPESGSGENVAPGPILSDSKEVVVYTGPKTENKEPALLLVGDPEKVKHL